MSMEDLRKEIDMLRAALKEATEVKEEAGREATGATRPVYVAPGRRLDVFSGKQTCPSDQTVHDWVSSMRAQLELRGLKGR